MNTHHTHVPPAAVRWVGETDGYLELLDQTRLPTELVQVPCREVAQVWEAIKTLRVRGAPAIGIAAAYGVVLSQREGPSRERALAAADYLATSRPTAVNLFWALDRMRSVVHAHAEVDTLPPRLLREAAQIHEEDRRMCRAIGRHGAALLGDSAVVITHCNAGGLATSEYGTALSVLFTCQDQGKSVRVFVDETRPLWQGARLTAWELQQRGIAATLICDAMAAHVMQTHHVDAVIVGADRITARGDVANKIGTYSLAIAARHHGVPFYVAAPSSTFDMALREGTHIPIEQRDASEIAQPFGHAIAPAGIDVYNPAFDVTPAELITALITERGIITPVSEQEIRRVVDA
ncbi:MAG: methylthioribose-1-phosphate isomerase [Pirellulaceae bacterium]|nr:MAG: methylthioribose-1-phosphate isomerase [Pirellulaceae bacterium]